MFKICNCGIGAEIAHVLLQQGYRLCALALGKIYAATAYTKGKCAAQFQFNTLSKSLAPVLVVGVCQCNGRVIVYFTAL